MKAVVIAPRFPWPSHTGERLRATIWLSALARNADVTLIAPEGQLPDSAKGVRFVPARRSLMQNVRGAFAVFRRGLPLQCLLSSGYDWRTAVDTAGPHDVTIVLLSRMHPWVSSLLSGRRVLDGVDSLQRSAGERRKAAAGPMRLLWAFEQRRMAKLELGLASQYDEVIVVSEEETSAFGGGTAISNGVAMNALNGHHRQYDFGFWGRFPYFANEDATRWLLEEIWPVIRSLRPQSTMIVGGAEASESLVKRAQRRGVTLVSPIADVPAFARDIRVALMPVRFGSGQSNKVLEAAEAGCAIVGTAEAMRGLDPLMRLARVESNALDFARAAVELIDDEARRASLAVKLRDAVEKHYARSGVIEKLASIAEDR